MEFTKVASICLFSFIILNVSAKPTHHKPEGRIVGGHEVKPHSIPYAVALIDDYDNEVVCGGSLISQNYVLTSAGCLEGSSDLIVALGVHNWTVEEPTQVRLRVNKSNFIINPNKTHFLYDFSAGVGLIKLPQTVTLNEYIQLAPLPPFNYTFKGEDYYQKGIIYGWGKREGDFSNDVLQYGEVELRIEPYGTASSFFVSYVSVDEAGICDGDSGAPLIADGIQLGISALGYGRCEEGINIHMSVPHILRWINETTDANIK